MKHLQLFEELGNPPQTLTLYLYEQDWEGTAYVSFLAPSDDFMTQIMQDFLGDDDSDFQSGDGEDYAGNNQSYTLEKKIDITEGELTKLGIDPEERFKILTRSGISFEDLNDKEKHRVTDYMEIETEIFNFLSFDAKREAKRCSNLTNDMLDELCMEIIKYRTWNDDARGFKSIKR